MSEARWHGRKGRPWVRIRAAVLAESDLCGWCGHVGADAVDHIVARSMGGAPHDRANLRAIHGVAGCPTCGRKCNSEKGAGIRTTPVPTSRAW